MLYLGELNGRQEAAWRKTVELFGEDSNQTSQVALFAENHLPSVGGEGEVPIVAIRLSSMRLVRPKQWGACWLGCELWRQFGLNAFWQHKPLSGRKGARWDKILQMRTLYRLIAPISEWRLHRHWFEQSALADPLGEDSGLEDPEDIRRFGYSRDKRSDCVQVVVALIVTPEGFAMAYEVLSGNTADKTTLGEFCQKIEAQYGRGDRIWVMESGILSEGILEQMKSCLR